MNSECRLIVVVDPRYPVPNFNLKSLFGEIKNKNNRIAQEMQRYFWVDAPNDSLESIAQELLNNDSVETAYIRPTATPAAIAEADLELHVISRTNTPNFEHLQRYLDQAPDGVDARYAWNFNGGKGSNIRIIDIERGWNFFHEDLLENQGGVIGRTNSRNNTHGTLVMGELSGDENRFGITGICPEAIVYGISTIGRGPDAIRLAADYLSPGDIILLEMHIPGPRYNYETRRDQKGYIPVEWFADYYLAIKYASEYCGVLVVEAAGNGAENLDDDLYDIPYPGAPRNWVNPFRRSQRDSGAIVVGAGAPPVEATGRNYGIPRSRLAFSNYSEMVDAQGWGAGVTSTGRGDLHRGRNQNQYYSNSFGGTSSASPIVTGVLACYQGILRSYRYPLMDYQSARSILRSTGTSQEDAPGRPKTQRIGNLPNLRQIIRY